MPDEGPPGGVSDRLHRASKLVFAGLRRASTELTGIVEDGVRQAKTEISQTIGAASNKFADYHHQQALDLGFSDDEAEIVARYVRTNYSLQGKQPSQGSGPDRRL